MRTVAVCDLQKYAETFRDLPRAAFPLKIEFSDPWHFSHSYRDKRVPFASSNGVYLYTSPNKPWWNIPLDQNGGEVWYIGKSEGNVADRVWAHMGAIYDPATGKPCEPRFKYHQWAESKYVPSEVRNAIAYGHVVVYTIRVETDQETPGISLALEKYLLSCCFRASGKLPLLNIDM